MLDQELNPRYTTNSNNNTCHGQYRHLPAGNHKSYADTFRTNEITSNLGVSTNHWDTTAPTHHPGVAAAHPIVHSGGVQVQSGAKKKITSRIMDRGWRKRDIKGLITGSDDEGTGVQSRANEKIPFHIVERGWKKRDIKDLNNGKEEGTGISNYKKRRVMHEKSPLRKEDMSPLDLIPVTHVPYQRRTMTPLNALGPKTIVFGKSFCQV